MTIEEKAKAYDEALEIARKIHNEILNNEILGFPEQIRKIFPQLCESEDERSRKWILEYLYDGLRKADEQFKGQFKTAIAYIEKQKEEEEYEAIPIESTLEYKIGFKAGRDFEKQKESLHISETCKENPDSFTDENERISKWIKKEIEDKYVVEGIVNNKLADEAFGWLEKQKYLYETTKDRFYREGFEEGRLYERQKEQKPAEPSDEELQRHQNKLYDFKVFAARQAREHHISFVHDFEWNNFCAELLSYFNEKQKPAEWSAEDEKKMLFLERLIKYNVPDGQYGWVDGRNGGFVTKSEAISMLKSLRPQKLDASKLENFDPVDVLNRIKTEWPMAWEKVVSKQEWSEEDELMIKCCQKAIQFFRENAQRNEKGIRLPAQFSVGGYLATPDKVESWLKSLRPPQDRCKDCPHRGDMFLLTQGFKSGKNELAIRFMNYLDENRPEGKMSLSNAECEDIDKAFKENDWEKILKYTEKYGKEN